MKILLLYTFSILNAQSLSSVESTLSSSGSTFRDLSESLNQSRNEDSMYLNYRHEDVIPAMDSPNIIFLGINNGDIQEMNNSHREENHNLASGTIFIVYSPMVYEYECSLFVFYSNYYFHNIQKSYQEFITAYNPMIYPGKLLKMREYEIRLFNFYACYYFYNIVHVYNNFILNYNPLYHPGKLLKMREYEIDLFEFYEECYSMSEDVDKYNEFYANFDPNVHPGILFHLIKPLP